MSQAAEQVGPSAQPARPRPGPGCTGPEPQLWHRRWPGHPLDEQAGPSTTGRVASARFPGTKGTCLPGRAGARLSFFLLPGQQFDRKSDARSGSFGTCPLPARRQLQGRWGLPAGLFRVLPGPAVCRGVSCGWGTWCAGQGLTRECFNRRPWAGPSWRALLRGHRISEAQPSLCLACWG